MLPGCPPNNPVNAKFPSRKSLCSLTYLQSSVFLSSRDWYKRKMQCQVPHLPSRKQLWSSLPACRGRWDGKIPGSVCHYWASGPALDHIIASLLVLWRKMKYIWSARLVKFSPLFSQSILNVYTQLLNCKMGRWWSLVKHNQCWVLGT